MTTKPSSRSEVNTFVQGLITEASPLNFPPNASYDEENFVLHTDGSRSRRLGMAYEPDYVTVPTGISSFELASVKTFSYVWKNVNGDPTLNILVTKGKTTLLFFDLREESISAGYMGSLNIAPLLVNIGSGGKKTWHGGGAASPKYLHYFSVSSIEGDLVAVGGNGDVGIITYTAPSTFTLTTKRITVRDLWGVEEDTAIEEDDPLHHPLVLSQAHYYNLQNQSWGITRYAYTADPIPLILGTYSYDDPVTIYKDKLGYYPSNSEAVWAGLQFQPQVGAAPPMEAMYPNLYKDLLGSGAPSAKGYYIIDLLNRGQSRVDEVNANQDRNPVLDAILEMTLLPEDFNSEGATLVHQFAGRVWYGGFIGSAQQTDERSPTLSDMVFFSQLVKNKQQITKCYQEGDPTSREASDLVDTDGGFIKIIGMGAQVGFGTLDSSLIIFAENGVWAVNGGSDYGFTASNYKVTKISNIGCGDAKAIVSLNSQVIFWSTEGIYNISKNNVGELVVTSVSEKTIQSFYMQFAQAACEGVFSPLDKSIRWVFRSGNYFDETGVTYELVLNTSLPAFSLNVIKSSNPTIAGIFIDPYTLQCKYITVSSFEGGTYYSIGYYRDPLFHDFGVDAKAFVLTGAQTAGDSGIVKQMPYLTLHFTKTEDGIDIDGNLRNPSSCLFRTQWDWAVKEGSNRFSRLSQGYRYRPALLAGDTYELGTLVVTTKNKIRGRGRAFALYMETEPEKDCKILGWNLSLNGNQIT